MQSQSETCPPPPAAMVYLDALASLWPGSAPGLARSDSLVPREPGGFHLLPAPDRVRMLVPADRPAAAARSVLRLSSAVGPRERVTRVAAAAALLSRTVRPELVARLEGEPGVALLDELSRRLGMPLSCCITLGPARANRKPVMQLFDARSSRTVAFAKVGDTPTAAPHVVREHQSLRVLAGAQLPTALRVPRLVEYFEWEERPVLVMEALPTPVMPPRPRSFAVLRRLMQQVSVAFSQPARPLPDVTGWQGLVSRLPDIVDEELRARLSALVARSESMDSGRAVPVGAWHGDWTAWNMAWRRGRLLLWDWERFETGVPAGLDAVHYVINEALTTGGATGTSDLAPALERHGLLTNEGRRTASIYVCFILDRYLQNGARPDGALRRRVDAVLALGENLVGTTD